MLLLVRRYYSLTVMGWSMQPEVEFKENFLLQGRFTKNTLIHYKVMNAMVIFFHIQCFSQENKFALNMQQIP